MAGFFGIGGKTKFVDEPDQPAQEKKGAFFLDSDEAKSLGKKIELMKKAVVKGKDTAIQALSKPESSSSQKTQSNSVRRSADNSMDMFRKMAKDMKK